MKPEINPNNIDIFNAEFIKEMHKQLCAIDTYGNYNGWPAERILKQMVLTKEQRREIPVIGDPDEITMSRVKAYYNALANIIERRTEIMASCVINLSHEGFGRALVTVGKLIVIDKTLRDVHRFGFDSLEALNNEAEKIITHALDTISHFPAAAAA
jgi:probable nitrogen fixation protein